MVEEFFARFIRGIVLSIVNDGHYIATIFFIKTTGRCT